MALGASPLSLNGICFKLRMMSVASSTTPGIDWNSCNTPSIYRSDRRSFNRAEQDAPQSVAHGGSEATFKGLRPEHSVLVGEAGGIGCEAFRFLKTLPKHCFLLRPLGSELAP